VISFVQVLANLMDVRYIKFSYKVGNRTSYFCPPTWFSWHQVHGRVQGNQTLENVQLKVLFHSKPPLELYFLLPKWGFGSEYILSNSLFLAKTSVVSSSLRAYFAPSSLWSDLFFLQLHFVMEYKLL